MIDFVEIYSYYTSYSIQEIYTTANQIIARFVVISREGFVMPKLKSASAI